MTTTIEGDLADAVHAARHATGAEDPVSPVDIGAAMVVAMPAPTGVTATDTAAYAAAFAEATLAAVTQGRALITFQSGTYSLPGGVTPANGISHLGVTPGISQINQGSGYLPDGDWNYTSGTILKGNVDGSPTGDAIWANTTAPAQAVPGVVGASQIQGADIIGFGIDGYINGLHIGAHNIMGLVWSKVDKIWAKNCSGWGIQMVNYQHIDFGYTTTGLCTNGQWYGSSGDATDGQGFDWGNSTHRYIFHKAGQGSHVQRRNVVFEADGLGGSPSHTIGTVDYLQVNAYNQPVLNDTAVVVSGTAAIGVTDGTKYYQYMPVIFSTTLGNITAKLCYIVQSVSGNTITIASDNSGQGGHSVPLVPSASGSIALTTNGAAAVEMIATSSAGAIDGDILRFDIEGNPTVGVYAENFNFSRASINSSSGIIDIVGRACSQTNWSSQGQIFTDFDSASATCIFNGHIKGVNGLPLQGLRTDDSRGGTGSLYIGFGSSGGSGGDIEARSNALLYPTRSGFAEHMTVEGASTTLGVGQCGLIVATTSGITLTLPAIVTQTSSAWLSNIGLWYEVMNLTAGSVTVTITGSNFINRPLGGATSSVTIPSGQSLKFIAAETNSSTQFWVCFQPPSAAATPAAGAILATVQYAPSSLVTETVTATSLTAFDTTNLTISFTVPPSGNVTIRSECNIGTSGSGDALLGWLTHGTTTIVGLGFSVTNSTSFARFAATQQIIGLTPGAGLQYDLAGSNNVSGQSAIIHAQGNAGSINNGPVLLQVVAS